MFSARESSRFPITAISDSFCLTKLVLTGDCMSGGRKKGAYRSQGTWPKRSDSADTTELVAHGAHMAVSEDLRGGESA